MPSAADRLLLDADGPGASRALRGSAVAQHEVPPVGVLLSDVEPEEVSWLWYPWIPLGKVTVLDGDPGLGKSTLALELAARITTGREMPSGDGRPGDPAGVVILTAEDDLADTVRPRLDAAGANAERALAVPVILSQDTEGAPPTLPDDLPSIGRAVERVQARLVIVDPLMAFLGADTNSHRDQDVRRVLHLLARLAEDTGTAVLLIRHLNKASAGNPLYRGGGSIGIIGAARSGLLVAKDPDAEPLGRVLASTKCNLAPQPDSLAFHIEQVGTTSRVAWDGLSQHGAADLLCLPGDASESSQLDQAKDVLQQILAGGPVLATEGEREAKAAGVAERTLARAKKVLGVSSRKRGRVWYWERSDAVRMPRQPSRNDGSLGDLDDVGTMLHVQFDAERVGRTDAG